MSNWDKAVRALRGNSPNDPKARRVEDTLSIRGQHPTTGSSSIMQQAGNGGAMPNTTSLNVVRTDGTTGKAFCWGVPNFGWGQGQF